MSNANKTSRQPKSAPLPPFRQRLSYVLALLFVFVSLNPAQAGMTMGQGMMAVSMAVSIDKRDSTVQAVMALSDAAQSSQLAGERSTSHVMPLNMKMNMAGMSTEDDCQPDCDCCPGLCSVYLPSNLAASTFLSANFALADSAFLGKVSAITRLFRPPISH